MKDLKQYGFNTDNKVYVIAEIGINHGGDLNQAKRLIDSAAKTGVDAVKFQTYQTETRAPKSNKLIFDILKRCELPFEAFAELQEYARQYALDFFSTPFDRASVDYLQRIDCPLYKVASFDVTNHDLLRAVAEVQKPVVLSIGMANLHEVKQAYEVLKGKTDQITLLHCVSAYPTQEHDANLAAIPKLRSTFDCVIGQSDHTNDITVPLFAVAAGAQVIEKHYKIDDDMDCIDAPVSITESQMTTLVREIRRVEGILGAGHIDMQAVEEGAQLFRRFSR